MLRLGGLMYDNHRAVCPVLCGNSRETCHDGRGRLSSPVAWRIPEEIARRTSEAERLAFRDTEPTEKRTERTTWYGERLVRQEEQPMAL